ncbi:Rrf2 family transcriptional regulator [Oceanobacillus neutriphilus]|uniref:Transcriptional regulator n=1 Tax=Oceanobacillus neutriphilus TaxID=531815 RepID=A0ABQ2P0B2_9BACI|nr:Rrf2 family transcriptional regulator [Oceanobacillus neutriphilus]GGP14923.1 transcriptional regulator [Oceanobacillus neutriphilus]
MPISSRFAVGIHILTLIEVEKDKVISSESLAKSVNTNPAVIRKIMGMLKKAGLINIQPGIAGAQLAKDFSKITLLDVYKAVNVVKDKELFAVHENPNPDCIVGKNIQHSIEQYFFSAQTALEKVLEDVTIEDVVKDITEKREGQWLNE